MPRRRGRAVGGAVRLATADWMGVGGRFTRAVSARVLPSVVDQARAVVRNRSHARLFPVRESLLFTALGRRPRRGLLSRLMRVEVGGFLLTRKETVDSRF